MHYQAEFMPLEIDPIVAHPETMQRSPRPLQLPEVIQRSAHDLMRQAAKLTENLQLKFLGHSRQFGGAGRIEYDLKGAHGFLVCRWRLKQRSSAPLNLPKPMLHHRRGQASLVLTWPRRAPSHETDACRPPLKGRQSAPLLETILPPFNGGNRRGGNRPLYLSGSAYGNRTRLSALRGPCPKPIDERARRYLVPCYPRNPGCQCQHRDAPGAKARDHAYRHPNQSHTNAAKRANATSHQNRPTPRGTGSAEPNSRFTKSL
jgi:hypothetical protein